MRIKNTREFPVYLEVSLRLRRASTVSILSSTFSWLERTAPEEAGRERLELEERVEEEERWVGWEEGWDVLVRLWLGKVIVVVVVAVVASGGVTNRRCSNWPPMRPPD